MSKLVIPFLVVCFSQCASTACSEETADKRQRYLASRLDKQIPEIEKGDMPLPLLLEQMAAFASDPEGEKNPDKRATILLDSDAFKQVRDGMFDFDRQVIKFNTKLSNCTLATVLDQLCQQLDAGYVVRKDFIEIVPIRALRKELNHPNGHDRDLRNLVVRFYDKTTLRSAMNDLAEKHGRTVVLSPFADKELETVITARLINVPFDTAVETLADMANLKLVRKSNVLFVTTKEQAAVLNAEHEQQLQAEKAATKEQEKLEMSTKEEKKP